MDAERALADLLELSRDVETVALLDADGGILASNAESETAAALAETVVQLVREAERVKPGRDARLMRLVAPTSGGRLFVVRDGDRAVVATAARSAPLGLVVHDLRSCLRALAAAHDDETADARA